MSRFFRHTLNSYPLTYVSPRVNDATRVNSYRKRDADVDRRLNVAHPYCRSIRTEEEIPVNASGMPEASRRTRCLRQAFALNREIPRVVGVLRHRFRNPPVSELFKIPRDRIRQAVGDRLGGRS